MTGFVQGEELEELYSNCYIYCLPSEIEGMSISLLEAMSYGKRCLISNIPENITVCGKYAITFEKGNVYSLKEKIEECLDNNIKCQSEEISRFILDKYNWSNVIDKTIELYEGREK